MDKEVWFDARNHAFNGLLDQWLAKRSPDEWHEATHEGYDVLRLALQFDGNENAACMLINKGFDVNTIPGEYHDPIILLVAYAGPVSYLRILCAANANLHVCNRFGATALAIAISRRRREHVFVLIANGMRLRDVHSNYQNRIDSLTRRMEHNILRFRSRVVVLLRVKKAGNLWRWDKFLLKEIALAVWSTRYLIY